MKGIITCRNEIVQLQQKLEDEQQRYNEKITADADTATVPIPIPNFVIHDQFKIDKEAICYLLIIELITPIDFVLLQVSSRNFHSTKLISYRFHHQFLPL